MLHLTLDRTLCLYLHGQTACEGIGQRKRLPSWMTATKHGFNDLTITGLTSMINCQVQLWVHPRFNPYPCVYVCLRQIETIFFLFSFILILSLDSSPASAPVCWNIQWPTRTMETSGRSIIPVSDSSQSPYNRNLNYFPFFRVDELKLFGHSNLLWPSGSSLLA